jgi:hypothetical protein
LSEQICVENHLDIVRIAPGSGRKLPASDDESPSKRRGKSSLETALGLLTSFILHLVALVVLALMLQVVPIIRRSAEIVLAPAGEGAAEFDGVVWGEPSPPQANLQADSQADLEPNTPEPTVTPPLTADVVEEETAEPIEVPPLRVATLEPVVVPPTDAQNGSGKRTAPAEPNLQMDLGDALTGRVGARKQQLLGESGGSEGSELAVQLALRWLANHQEADGSWRLDFQAGPHCGGQCGQPGGKAPAKNAATALALLPFLGSGYSHKQGPYAEVVELGLDYLKRSIRKEAAGGSFMDEGQMYSHGLATIVLCEALTMTQDQSLFIPARDAVKFIVAAQNESKGGWRYRPGEMGDTTVTGWQLMALKTASMSYINVPSATIRQAWSFLDAVETPLRYQYGYQEGGRYEKQKRRPAKSKIHATTSAVGLLSRMYLGWEQKNKVLTDGVHWLSDLGPSVDRSANLYYNYYATQVMRHYGGEPWEAWNPVMRDFLIASQSQNRHERGSWFFPGEHNEAGGRLYCTAMATLILEVYYRHLPLYSKRAVAEKFRL